MPGKRGPAAASCRPGKSLTFVNRDPRADGLPHVTGCAAPCNKTAGIGLPARRRRAVRLRPAGIRAGRQPQDAGARRPTTRSVPITAAAQRRPADAGEPQARHLHVLLPRPPVHARRFPRQVAASRLTPGGASRPVATVRLEPARRRPDQMDAAVPPPSPGRIDRLRLESPSAATLPFAWVCEMPARSTRGDQQAGNIDPQRGGAQASEVCRMPTLPSPWYGALLADSPRAGRTSWHCAALAARAPGARRSARTPSCGGSVVLTRQLLRGRRRQPDRRRRPAVRDNTDWATVGDELLFDRSGVSRHAVRQHAATSRTRRRWSLTTGRAVRRTSSTSRPRRRASSASAPTSGCTSASRCAAPRAARTSSSSSTARRSRPARTRCRSAAPTTR